MPTPFISWLIVLVALSLVEEASHSSVEDSPLELDDDNTSSTIHPANMFILLGAAYYFITITMPSSSSIIWRLPLIWLFTLHALCFWLVLSLVRAWCYWSKLSKKKKMKKVWTKVKKKPKAKMKAAEDSSSLFSRMRRMLMLGGRRRNRNGDGDGCNHGLDLPNTNGGLKFECVLYVKMRLHEAMWGSSETESIGRLVSYFLMTATKQYLNGNIDMAGVDASFANIFNQLKAVVLDETKPKIDWHEVVRIHNADKPTLAAFLRERIPCTCLD
eukprot:scaffold14195_cov155-Skeletonema_dohrnii-CCMP3373.AAC.29